VKEERREEDGEDERNRKGREKVEINEQRKGKEKNDTMKWK
jgi:hypothetical protein